MLELIRITAQYSNAVLVAIMPHVSDFAAKVGVPVRLPITTNQVLEFKCDPRKDHVGGSVVLTNHFEFTYLYGRVCVYRSPDSYFSLQDPERIPSFYGKINVDETKALRSVHEVIRKLGYTDATLHADTAPKITRPEKIGTNDITRYRFQWLDPQWRGTTNSGITPAILDAEVNASNGRIEMMTISSLESHGPNPKISVEPEVIPLPTATQPKQSIRDVWANKEYALEALRVVLPSVSDFIAKVELPITVPVTTNDVDMTRYTCVIESGNPIIQIYLKNGDRFNYLHGHIAAYYAHDAFLKFPDRGRVEDFLGIKTLSTNDVVNLAKATLRRLGYTETKMDVITEAPSPGEINSFTRLFVHLQYSGSDSDIASFEMDLHRKGIKSVYFDDHSVWGSSPTIRASAITQTNRPSF